MREPKLMISLMRHVLKTSHQLWEEGVRTSLLTEEKRTPIMKEKALLSPDQWFGSQLSGWLYFLFFFLFLFFKLWKYDNTLQETWKIQNKVTYSSTILQFFKIHKYFQLEFQYQTLKNQQNEQTEKQKNRVDLKSIVNQFSIRFIQFSRNSRIQILFKFPQTINQETLEHIQGYRIGCKNFIV